MHPHKNKDMELQNTLYEPLLLSFMLYIPLNIEYTLPFHLNIFFINAVSSNSFRYTNFV